MSSARPQAAWHSLPWLLSLLLHASLAGLVLVLPARPAEQEQLRPIEIVQRELPPPPKAPEPPPPEEEPLPQPTAAISQQAPPVRPVAPPRQAPPSETPPEPQDEQPQDTGPKTFGIEMSGTTTAAPGTGVQVPVGDSLAVSPQVTKRGPKPPAPPPRQGFKGEYAPGEVAPVAALTTKPKLLQPVVPEYPERMRELGIEGRVYVEVTVDATGKVAAVRLLKGLHPELDALALQAARQLRFGPATVNGKPVRTKIPVPFTFVLD